MRNLNSQATHRARQQGFTLIEVLVTLIVLAVGIMGSAGLQVTALKDLQSSRDFGTAGMLANDIAERMWVNQAQVLANAYDHTEAPNNPPDCVGGTCTAAQMAVYDINDWQQQITGYTTADDVVVPAMLPGGSGEVDRDGTTNNFDITLRWDDDNSGSTDTNCPPASADDLDCYTLKVFY